MKSHYPWRRLLIAKGLYNCVGTVGLVVFSDWALNLLGLDAGDRLFFYLFALHAFVFGLGFMAVAFNPDRNHTIIATGAFAQLGLAGLVIWYTTSGSADVLLLVPGAVDLVFGVLFLVFLWNYQWSSDEPRSVRTSES
ncbi:hypothetical protein [Ruegeria sp. HKCCA4008]|uniref:hypothetical protein n=1 Tax=Ruegeria sp. HKCCA4008 TaxID=2682999 RepID=UPI001C2C5DA4|nr:hypothetical protein [Ruegeria sp. HKCCA4008]